MSKTNAKRDESRVGIKHVNRNALGRLMKIIVSNHRGTLIVVMISILVTVFTNVANSMFLSTLIDDYITPMLATGSRDFSGLDRAPGRHDGISMRPVSWQPLPIPSADGKHHPGHPEHHPGRYVRPHAAAAHPVL